MLKFLGKAGVMLAIALSCIGSQAHATSTPPPLTQDDLDTWLDGYMPYALKRGDVAGAMIVVVKDNAVLFEKGYGYADIEKRVPVDPRRTLFRPGSTSKLFTWTAVMQLVERGKLDLDRDVNAYLDFKIPSREGRPITLRNVLTHTAGFEETVKGAAAIDPADILPLDRYLKSCIPRRIHPPGEVPAYSNYATSLAGYIVQRISGETFAQYIDHHIFQPLGMMSSSFEQPLPPALAAQLSKGYRVASEPPGTYEIFATAPAGNLSATGDDMARFMLAHLNDGAFGSNRILEPNTARLMHGTAWTILPAVNRMLLGFYETHRNGRRIIGHAGDTQLFHSFLHLFIDDHVGLYIALNSTGADYSSSSIRTALFEGFTDRYFPGPTTASTLDPATAAQHASAMAGLYRNSRRSESNFLSISDLLSPVEVFVHDDNTIGVSSLTDFSGQVKTWREIAPFVWRDVRGEDLLAAKFANDRPVMFSTDEFSPYMVLQPYNWWNSPAWLSPAIKLALLACAATLVMWPIRALTRRYYGVSQTLSVSEVRAYRLVRIAVAAVLLALLAWASTFQAMLASSMPFTSRADAWFWLLNIGGAVIFFGAALIALRNVVIVWRGSQPWFAKLWSVMLALSCATVLWVACAFKFISFNVNY